MFLWCCLNLGGGFKGFLNNTTPFLLGGVVKIDYVSKGAFFPPTKRCNNLSTIWNSHDFLSFGPMIRAQRYTQA